MEDVSPAVRRLVARCLTREPTGRPSALEVVRALDAELSGLRLPELPPEGPFRGLAAFQEAHAPMFFGRGAEIAAFTERLRDHPVLPVVGASGAGKSSFVLAGVIPRLREQARWVVLRVRPGRHPFRVLARAIEGALGDGVPPPWLEGATGSRLAARLRAAPGLVGPLLLHLAGLPGARVLLLVDQVEELFTHVDDPETRHRFLDVLLQGADEAAEPARIVFTLRDDFLGRLAEGRQVLDTLAPATVLRRPDAQALHEIVTEPLSAAGYAFEDPELAESIVRAVEGERAGLPLLQFACRELWARRDPERCLLLRSAYTAIGGVGGALAAHASAVMRGLTSERELSIARALLLRLVTPERTRRIVPAAELLDGLGPDAPAVLDRLVNGRLVTTHRSEAGAGAEVELAHESLVTEWGELRALLDTHGEDHALLAELDRAAALWADRGRPAEEVWRGDALAEARRRLSTLESGVPARVREFVDAGTAVELGRRRRRRWALGGMIAVLVAATVASLFVAAAFQKKEGEANRERRRVEEASERMALAASDLGLVDLDVQAFDWDPDALAARSVPASRVPDLRWTFYEPDRADPSQPGDPVAPQKIRRGTRHLDASADRFTERVEVRAGPAFLRLEGRGRAGQSCGPSWLRLRWLPGYAERERPTPLRIRVPTCAATRAGTLAVPAGPFVFGGAGDPPTRFPAFADPPESTRTLTGFRMDRTEVSNAAYAVYAEMGAVTGRSLPAYPSTAPLDLSGRPDHPVSYVDWYEARDYCRFLGKRLPTSQEWEKAARGGLTLDRAGRIENPRPRRNLPWGTDDRVGPANLMGDEDGYAGTSPVGSYPEGASPYGILDLAGNVHEWTSTRTGSRMLVVRGGSWDVPAEREEHTIAYTNVRDPRFVAFNGGIRCVLDTEAP